MGADRFAVIVTGKEMRSDVQGKPVVGKEGDRYWVTYTEWGPSSALVGDGNVPENVMIWETEAEASTFARAWRGHPWWCAPQGRRFKFQVVQVVPNMVTRQEGWNVSRA